MCNDGVLGLLGASSSYGFIRVLLSWRWQGKCVFEVLHSIWDLGLEARSLDQSIEAALAVATVYCTWTDLCT